MAKLPLAVSKPDSPERPSAKGLLVVNVSSKSPVALMCMSNCTKVVCSHSPAHTRSKGLSFGATSSSSEDRVEGKATRYVWARFSVTLPRSTSA